MSATLMTSWTRRPKRVLPPCACSGMLVALLTGLLAGCMVIPAKVKVAQSGNVQAPSEGISLSVLLSHDFSPETPKHLGAEMVECVTRGLAEAAPEVRLVPEEEFYRAVFGVKPGEALLRADTIGTLLARPDIRQRVSESGLTHLILVGSATHHRGGPSSFLSYQWKRRTRLTASIFELARGAQVLQVDASAEGGGMLSHMYPFLPLVALVAPTESPSCEALGAEVARAIRTKPHDETR